MQIQPQGTLILSFKNQATKELISNYFLIRYNIIVKNDLTMNICTNIFNLYK